MTSEIEAVPSLPCVMKLLERSYFTPPGWRLATVQEAKQNLEMIEHQRLLKKGERARLLDGWISGPFYDIEIGDDFRRFLGYMLVIQIQGSTNSSSGNSGPTRSSIYADVTLTPTGREVALLLCVYDWNYEVVYWLINCWENRVTFNPLDVREGNIPLTNRTRFVEVNRMICHLCRILGEEGIAGQKAARRELSQDSVREVMVILANSCWNKFSQKHKNILPRQAFLNWIDEFISLTINRCSEVNWYQFSSKRDTSDAIWNFLWHHISSCTLVKIVHESLSFLMEEFNSEERQEGSRRDFIMSTAILYHLLEYEKYMVKRILESECKDAGGDDRKRFKDALKNTSSAYYDKTGNYHVFNKILIYALQSMNGFVVNKVLEWGAQPEANLGPDNQSTALHYAILFRYGKEIVRSFFDKCHSKEELANAVDDQGMTALHLACQNDVSICEMVLEYGGRPDVRDNTGRLPLHYAVKSQEKEIVRSLFDKCHLKEELANTADKEGMTALHLACQNADVSICEMVLEYGGRPDVRDNTGRLPLHYAVERNLKEIVRSLFDKCHLKEEFANAADNEGMTALHISAGSNADASICKMLLEEGGNPDILDKRRRLPLHYAVEENNEDIVDVLIGVGNSDAVQNQDVSKLNPEMVEMVTQKDNDGVSPLDMAVKKNNGNLMMKLLLVSQQPLASHFDKGNFAQFLHKFALEGNLEVTEKLLQKGADPRARDWSGKTALHYASMCEDEDKALNLTRLMLDKCTSEEDKKKWVEEKDDEDHQTVLHVAAMKGDVGLCDIFCEINNDILHIKDADGRGLLYEVVERSPHDNPNVIATLLHWYKYREPRISMDHFERCNIEVESIIDHSDVTLLHVAASVGKTFTADALIKMSSKPKVYLRTPDILGQTALHKAAKEGQADTVTILLHHGAHPLLERDSDGRTALHCAVQNEDEDQAKAVAELLLKCGSDEKKLLLLWASAAGLGTADQRLSDSSPLKKFLLQQKKDITEKLRKEGKRNNLLRTAACLGDIAMTKELITRGAQIGDIRDQNWMNSLNLKERHNVETVCKQIQIIAEQGNDQPAISDNLGRSDFAYGLAALLLNPYLKPPITVGISGSWGMGKSSLMVQTEGILLKTAAQLALLPSEMTSSDFPGIQILDLSEKGEKKYQEIKTTVDLLHNHKNLEKNLFLALKDKIGKWWMNVTNKKKSTSAKKGDSLRKFLNQYQAEYHHIFKSLAAMDSSYMFKPKDQQSQSEIDSPTEGSVPAILTVRYNAWKYRNESEALAGMAVEITKEMEGIMTDAQWFSTCLRNTWRKQKQVIWIEIIFPCLLAVLLAISFTWIVWLLLDRYKMKESKELKYASFPLTVVIMVWTLVKKVMSTVNPVSVQLMNYMKLPDHTEKLGYQERVISDITFLKEEISKKPYFLCIVALYMWHFITGSSIISLLSSKYRGESLGSSIPSANLRTIVFVDDIDRCQESVILQVLSATNLVLAVCQISVVLGMDKALIQRAIIKKYGDKSLKNSRLLADKYLQKIIQLPLDLPDPTEVQSKIFLDRHLGVFQNQSKEGHSQSKTYAEDDCAPEIDIAYNALFPSFQISRFPLKPDFGKMLGSVIPIPEGSTSAQTREPVPGTRTADTEVVAIDMQPANETNASNSQQTGPMQTLWQTVRKVAEGMQRINLFTTGCIQTNLETEAPQEANVAEGEQSLNDLIPIRQMLFMTYSKGEQNVFDYFQEMATDIRKLPREWKRLLNYHRLVWNIFLINNEAKDLYGWQVQLITWIFICWEWEENINILIENWDRLRALKNPVYSPPSLREIVDHFIKNESWIIADDKSGKKRDTAKASENSVNKDTVPQNLEGDKKEKGVSTNKEDPESSNLESSELKVDKGQMTEPQGNASNAGFPEALTAEIKKQSDGNEKLHKIEKMLAELREQVDSIVKQRQVSWNEKSAKEKKLKSESWGRLKFALQRYDVSMKGIQAFQRFRFYCVAGYLPWPLPDRKIADV